MRAEWQEQYEQEMVQRNEITLQDVQRLENRLDAAEQTIADQQKLISHFLSQSR